MSLWEIIAAEIGHATGAPFVPAGQGSVGGGCINAAVALEGADGRRFFVKLNDARRGEMFAAEAEGLQTLAQAGAVRVPAPVAWGEAAGQAYLVMEHLGLGGTGDMAAFGRRLAVLHRVTQGRFGWHRDNTIGATPQPNTPDPDWVSFWRRQRLGFQLELAARSGHRGRLQQLGAELGESLPALFSDYHPQPSLLHGDLWSGNYSFSPDGEPVIFDPAVYYGDREADLAMTELFGGFGSRFYEGYNDAWPIDPGYKVRKTLYNLYHILNHLNLFGGGYRSQAESMMGRLLSELR